jgi:hypothetical protein
VLSQSQLLILFPEKRNLDISLVDREGEESSEAEEAPARQSLFLSWQ